MFSMIQKTCMYYMQTCLLCISIMYYTVQFAIKNESTIINLFLLSMVWLVMMALFILTVMIHVHVHTMYM